MKRQDEIKYKRLFQIAALWNIALAGVGGFFLFDFMNKLVFGFDTVIPIGPTTFAMRLAYALITVFGIGYYFVSKDLSQNRGIVWAGILGKIAVFIIFLAYFIGSHITFLCMILGIGDLVFAVLFFVFILKQDAFEEGR